MNKKRIYSAGVLFYIHSIYVIAQLGWFCTHLVLASTGLFQKVLIELIVLPSYNVIANIKC